MFNPKFEFGFIQFIKTFFQLEKQGIEHRYATQQGNPAVHGITNQGGQVSPVQSHFVRRKFQVFRVCTSCWEKYAEL